MEMRHVRAEDFNGSHRPHSILKVELVDEAGNVVRRVRESENR